ncbi:ABC transporter substrate-binding protein [Nocardioides campestrisoli]|uniref:ABC transporter substrate-binding protein n=1 Tax=Nocardioides campestrisoli TaxID=2736757 RepID=UPI001CD2945B|nr:ABC transporter substrate-binding protein [Nocardioides campestrisoli]
MTDSRSLLPSRPASRRLVSSALAALATGVLLAGCTSAVGEQSATSGSGSQGPVEGGTLRVAATTDHVPASVFGQSSDVGNTLIGLVYDSLVEYPHDSLDAQPSLATSWEVAEDGRSITLQLRNDVTFHDGRPFTSEDVRFSIETFADPAWAVQVQRTAAAVTGFDTSDPHAITLEFAHPLSNILDLLDIVPIVDSESFPGLKEASTYNGTGPFRFTGWRPGTGMTFERNEDYWKGAPDLEAVDVSVVPDAQAQVAGLRSGQYDLALGVTPRDVETLEQDPKFDVHDFEGATQQQYLGFQLKNRDLQEVRLRQAIAYAVDRERIVEELYRGSAVASGLPWSPSSPAYDEEKGQTYARDVAKAQQLVAELGDVPTLPLQFAAGQPAGETIAQIVQANLEEIGLEVELKPTEFAQMYKQLVGAQFEGLWIFGHTYAQYTPATLTVSAFPFNAAHNASNFVDEQYRADSDASWKVADPASAEAEEPFDRVNDHIVDNVWLTDLVTSHPRVVTTSAVHGIDYSKRTELLLDEAWKDQ